MNISSYITLPKEKEEEQVARIFKVLSNPNRLKIMKLLYCNRGGHICVKEIAEAVGLSQSATSHQLALLEARGMVRGEKMGQTTCYFISNSSLTKNIERIIKMTC